MSRQRMRQDQQFWHIVKDLRWKLEDGNHGNRPPDEPEFGYGGGRGGHVSPWASHAIAFLLGGIAFGAALVSPALALATVLTGLIGCALFRQRHARR
jgi:hypothetical protein